MNDNSNISDNNGTVTGNAVRFKAIVFDMDGTLLNTLPDLTALTNAVLAGRGYSTYSIEEIRGFIGDGIKALMFRAVPDSASDAEKTAALEEWKRRYPEFGRKMTAPYEGISQTLAELKANGVLLGVLSNKFDAAVKELAEFHFPGTFAIAHGESPEYPRKPNPTGLLKMLDAIGVSPSEAAYVGDSAGDMKVAHAAGTFALGVSWGYQSTDALKENGADLIIDEPCDILDLTGIRNNVSRETF